MIPHLLPFPASGHPKEALFDIDLSLLYESPSDSEEEYDEAWGEIRFVNADGAEQFIILPIDLIGQWLGDPQAESAEFWKSILTNCRRQGCDELFHTLALIHRSGQPKGDQPPEAEPGDMLRGWFSVSTRTDGSGPGADRGQGTGGCNPGAGCHQGSGGGRSDRQADQGGSGGDSPEALAGMPNWEGKLTDRQFTMLELAFEIKATWSELANWLGLSQQEIISLERSHDSDHMKAFNMLDKFLGSKGYQWSLKRIHDFLRDNGHNELADKCREVADRTPPTMNPGVSLEQIFPRTSRMIRNMREPLLIGLYLGLTSNEIHSIRNESYGSEDTMARNMIYKLRSTVVVCFLSQTFFPDWFSPHREQTSWVCWKT